MNCERRLRCLLTVSKPRAYFDTKVMFPRLTRPENRWEYGSVFLLSIFVTVAPLLTYGCSQSVRRTNTITLQVAHSSDFLFFYHRRVSIPLVKARSQSRLFALRRSLLAFRSRSTWVGCDESRTADTGWFFPCRHCRHCPTSRSTRLVIARAFRTTNVPPQSNEPRRRSGADRTSRPRLRPETF